MSTNMDGPDALIQEVMELPVEDIYTLLVAVMTRLQPLAGLINGKVINEAANQGFAATGDPPDENDYYVKLDYVDPTKKIQTIKEIRVITRLGLKESKDIVDCVLAGSQSYIFVTGLTAREAHNAVKALTTQANALASVHRFY